jgi:SAM-dependent methyltransferase
MQLPEGTCVKKTPGSGCDPVPETPHPTDLAWTGERLIVGVEGDLALEHLHRYAVACSLAPGKTVLDIACGEGYGTNLLAGKAQHVIGVDLSQRTVEHARTTYQRQNLAFQVGACASIPLESASVDLVVSFETLEHHNEHQAMFAEIRRVLRPGGILLISTPDRSAYSEERDYRDPFHLQELSEEEFRALLDHTFRHVAIFHQRMAHGSMIVPAKGSGGDCVTWKGNYRELAERPGLVPRIHVLGIASDQEIPALTWGLFEGDGIRDDRELRIAEVNERERRLLARQQEEDTVLSHREEEVVQRFADFARLEKELSRRELDNQSLRESLSWRITSPLRFLGNWVSRLSRGPSTPPE